ncbi:MAG TPA: aspartate--ammonia ligase, partial [Bacillota bacterium]|nr:aspartate--ammonia ligase [Bacillota bacterium]
MPTIIPEGYKSTLNIYETQRAIEIIKSVFSQNLCSELSLHRVSAPLFVRSDSGLNDDLNGIERPVEFDIACTDTLASVVQSLAKWKRLALWRYGFSAGEGIYTDMNAIRRDEQLDNLHSVYTDQWDWEKIITPKQRTTEYLKQTVRHIVRA